MPAPPKFVSSFDKTSEIIESFVEKVGFARFGLSVHDYGGPGGFRIVTPRRMGLSGWLGRVSRFADQLPVPARTDPTCLGPHLVFYSYA